jgi:hypothetical protein
MFKIVLQECLKMPYYKNYAAESGAVHNITKHEEAITDVLIRNGFSEIEKTKDCIKTNKNIWIKDPSGCPIPVNSFISQPFGTHENPDFLVRVSEDILVPIEAKSCEDLKPMYNSGGIKPNYVYIFTSKKTNGTTIYRGCDIISFEQSKIIEELIKEQKKLEAIANIRLKELDIHHRGISYYTRPMIGQSGDKTYTNYFTHVFREKCEQNVLDSFV